MKIVICALLAIVLVAISISLSNPLRRSQEKIKESILELTPIGMGMDDVLKVIENNKRWEIRYVRYDFGYRRPGIPDPADVALGRGTYIGEKSIRVFLGDYRNIFITSVTVFWGFDENSKLIDVYVWKDADTL